MADITFTGYIEAIIADQNGHPFALNTSEPHRRQVDGEWATEARTYRDVKTSRTSGVELIGLRKGDRVTVRGTEKTEKYTVGGENRYRLVVWATSVERSGNTPVQPRTEPADTPNDPWVPSEPVWAVTPIPGDDVPW